MATRQWVYAEAPSQTSGISGTKVRLTFSGVQGDTWLIFANASVAGPAGGKLTVSLDEAATFDHSLSPIAATDFYSCPMYAFVTLGSGANNFNHTLNFINDLGSNMTIREASIFALKLDALDSIPADYSGVNITSTTFATVKSHTFNVPTTGDYLILCNAADYNGTLTADMNLRFTVDGTAYSDMAFRSNDTLFPYGGSPYLGMVKVNLAAGNHTIVIQAKTSAGTLQVYYATIIALRADTFPNLYYTRVASAFGPVMNQYDASTFYPAYTTIATQTQTTTNKPHVLFTSALHNEDGGDQTKLSRSRLDGATVQENRNQSFAAFVNENTHSATDQSTLTAASHTEIIQVTNAATNLDGTQPAVDSAVIALLELPTQPTLALQGGTFQGGIYI